MVSIKNDAFVIGAAATGAGAANIIAQNSAAIKSAASKVSTPVADAFVKAGTKAFNKDTYSELLKSVKKTFSSESFKKVINSENKEKVKEFFKKFNTENMKNFGKKFVEGETYTKPAKGFWEGLKSVYSGAKDKVIAFAKGTNWKTVGKYAAVAAGVALAAVVVKEIFTSKKENV